MIPVIPTKYLILAVAVSCFVSGWTVCSWKTGSDERDELVDAIAARTEREVKMQERAEAAEDKLGKLSSQTRAVKGKEAHETRADAYRCPLLPSGVRILNEARTGVESDPVGESNQKIP